MKLQPDASEVPLRAKADVPSERPEGSFAVAGGYVAGLDGLRAVAVVLVFLFHAKVPGFGAGFFGVDVFFVLSGFLITSLLMEEAAKTGTIRIGHFLWRRVLRLAPALVAMVAVFVLLAPHFPVAVKAPYLQSIFALSYLSDYSSAFIFGHRGELSHTWSLSVEAKFYLVWPVLLILILRKSGQADAWRAILFAAAIATLWRMANAAVLPDWNITYYRFDTRLSGLLLGAALAAVLWSSQGQRVVQMAARMLVIPAITLLLLPLAWGDRLLLVFGCSLVELASAIAILAVVGQSVTWIGFLGLPALAWLGRLSYGLYLWHYPVIRWMRPDWDWHGIVLVGFPVALALAWLSHVTLERFVLRFREKRVLTS
jgi:peptidoglycan/LPS O-acetylase OafA/YrhL